MNTTEVNKALKFIDVNALMKNTTIIWVHDTEKNITYKANIATLTQAIAKQLIKDGIIPAQGD